jgi:hypothetical protein
LQRDCNCSRFSKTESFLHLVLVAGLQLWHLWPLLRTPGSLTTNDWGLSWRAYDWIRQTLTAHWCIPLHQDGAMWTQDLLANPGSAILNPVVLLFAVGASTDTVLRVTVATFMVAGSVSMFVLLRTWTEPPVALLFTLVYAHSGYFAARIGIGHTHVLGCALFPVLWLALEQRRVLLGAGTLVLSAWCGFLHAFVWAVAFGSVYCAVAWRSLWTWGKVLTLALCLGALKFVPMWMALGGVESPGIGAPALTASRLLGALTMHGQNFKTVFVPGWGSWEHDAYVGWGALVLLTGATFCRAAAWRVLCVVPLVLATSEDVFLAAHTLPLFRTDRCPSRYLIVALFAACVLAARGWQSVLDASSHRGWLALALSLCAGLIAVDLRREALTWWALPFSSLPQSVSHGPWAQTSAGAILGALVTAATLVAVGWRIYFRKRD